MPTPTKILEDYGIPLTIASAILLGISSITKGNELFVPKEGDSREYTCNEGGQLTQTYQNGAWYPPCPEDYTLTITVSD